LPFLKNISPSLADDSDLLVNYKLSGDVKLLAALYERYMDLVYAVCLKYLKDQEVAKDAVMDLFAGLGEKVTKHDISNFRSWLYTVVKNHCLMQLRSASRHRSVELDESRVQLQEEMHPDGTEDNQWQFNKMSECIETLSPDQKSIIQLFYLQEKCYKEISAITGIDWNKVRSLIQNGRRNLKICMEKSKNSNEDVFSNRY
jgi:RNA polymerase sigma-70 factor (ECF subfamily)